MSLREPDHVPLCFKWWERPYLVDKDDCWRSEFERVLKLLKLGIDDTVTLKVPVSLNPEVETRVSKIHPAGEKYPLIVKEYHTAKGVLKRVVRQTPDWPHGDDIPLFTDFVVPRARSVKFLVEKEEDLDALSTLLAEPSDRELHAFLQEADRVKSFADKHGVLVEAGMTSENGVEGGVVGADALYWLYGLENTVKAAYLKPEFIQRMLDVIFEWDTRYIRLAVETGMVDLVVHRGWYENADFWPPRLYRRFILPYVKRLADKVHKNGLRFCYIMSMGIMPLLGFFKEEGVDVLYGVDPVQGGAKLPEVKKQIGDRVCVWGGLNSSVALTQWSRGEIEKAVAEAVETLAPGGGFILSAIDQIFPDTPWESIETVLEAWRRLADYPIGC
ncbi:MAG: uroporphyrinogen decarboxylase family protein [Thermofilum sp.]